MRPIIEPYSPIVPIRRERRRQRIEWPFTAFLVIVIASAFLWWLGANIVSSYNAGNPAFTDVYGRVVSAVSGQ